MMYFNSIIRIIIFLFLLAPALAANGKQVESLVYEGRLKVGKYESTIIYYGKESGDLAAFCFPNKSAAGRAILAECKNGELCKFSGRVDWEKPCHQIKEDDFSARAKIVSVKRVRKLIRKN